MALNHNTDMLYTRSGATESNVLSAHDPLIWEFEDTALVGGPATATVQFIVRDNDLAVIYTSAAFPAYLLSYVGNLTKFRFDGTHILKHIINNYLYKEISTIIEPVNYGSTVDVVFRTYDDGAANANDTVTYYLSQAVNQIGDEYGSNIPRLFLNDTEDIAHFLGYPTKIFFYLATDRSAHSPLVEIIDRDSAVEDSSDYGSLKIGVHCIDLGLLALSKKSKYARVYYDPDAPIKIKDYNLSVFEACENAIFVRWLNSNGDYSYWAFSPYPFRNKSGDKLGSVINNFTEMALANSRNLPLGYRDAFDKINVIASAVPLLFRRKMLEIFTSPAVYLWNGTPRREEKESDWILLNRVEGSHNLMLKKDTDNFECTLVLPENYTQQLSGQNI